MDANDAAATGALPGDVDPAELSPEPTPTFEPKHRRPLTETEMTVPGGATDPMWYLAANWLVPHLARSAQRVWIDGFVAAMEATRALDGDPGLGSVLRHSIGLEVEVPVAVREPSPYRADAESLARFLFERQAVTYDADPESTEAAWSDPGVHEFWLAEAEAVLRFLP